MATLHELKKRRRYNRCIRKCKRKIDQWHGMGVSIGEVVNELQERAVSPWLMGKEPDGGSKDG